MIIYYKEIKILVIINLVYLKIIEKNIIKKIFFFMIFSVSKLIFE